MNARRRIAGFTLIEALVAIRLKLGSILAALATITARWLPNWNFSVFGAPSAQ